MNLFYSIISAESQPNDDPAYSLGGWCSSSPVPSGVDAALFPLVSEYGIQQNNSQYICICLRNMFTETIDNIAFYIEKDPEQSYQCKYRVAFAAPVDRRFENVPTIHSRPTHAVFEEAYGEENMIFLPDMRPDDLLGIWLERSIDWDSPEIKCRNDNQWLFDEYIRRTRTNKPQCADPSVPACLCDSVSSGRAREETLDIRILWGPHEGRDLFRVGFQRPNDLLTLRSFLRW